LNQHFVIVIAALNLLDFDRIEKGAEQKMPKYMEWYGAMGLMITLVWLYIEFLRLLSKLNSKINNNRYCHKKKNLSN
jgi:uncharacterized YccA/Bax inhibitor family protein